MTQRQPIRRIPFALVVAAGLLGLATPAAAQLDPLLFLKTTRPNVLLIVDTSQRMLYDADGTYYDPWNYTTGNSWDSGLGNPLGLGPLDTRYRRKYLAFTFLNGGGDKWSASTIKTVGNSSLTNYNNFYASTRIEVAKAAMLQAVRENATSVRFGLLKTRQSSPSLPNSWGNERPVFVSDSSQQEPTDDSSTVGRWRVTRTTVGGNNHSQSAPTSPNFALVKADVSTANTDIITTLNKTFSTSGALLPAGNDSFNVIDSPVANMLSDAKSEAGRLIAADTACRNTIAVLIVGGGEGAGYSPSTSASALATQFKSISSRRVPIYVVAIAPPDSDVIELKAIASNSGGQYFEITKAQITAAVSAGVTVPEAVKAINAAVQHAFAKPADVNTAPTATLPYGPQTEYQTASPIVGTVNLKGLVPSTEWEEVKSAAGVQLPQRSNLMVTAGFAMPGFDGKVRGYRVYKPVEDATKAAGYKFVADGTLLWTATTPSESQRNIFTALPDGTMISFTTANASTLSPYLQTTLDVSSLITTIRSQPIGAVVGSTPAVLDAPSLDPPPDEDYPAFITENDQRRSMVIFGANDGMLHAVDARTGLEVWAYIPFNLLPKLKTLNDGQPIDSFGYFVDSSPKVADVKIDDEWRTYLIVGEGPGGTFYQTFDVTLDGLSSCVDQDNDVTSTLLGCFSSTSRIPLRWSFPDYSHFDYTYSSTSMPYGDLNSSATAVEKSVGQTWSDPAVGQIYSEDGPFAVLTGSGFFPYTAEQTSAVRNKAKAGRAFYILEAKTGTVLDSKDVGDDNKGETVDDCSTALPKGCTEIKNAIQADPVATGAVDSRFINKVFVGDLDGKVWRFTLGLDNSDSPKILGSSNLYSAGSADHPLFSSMAAVTVGTQQYLFFGTGSDLLPSAGVSGSYKLVGLPEGSNASFTISLTKTDGLADDEKVTAFPAVAGDIVFFTTTNFKPATPCSQPDANLYALTFIGGAAYASSNDSDDKMGKNESPKVKTLSGVGRATAPFIVDQHLWFGAGDKIEAFGDPEDFNNGVGQIGVRILSWRQIR